MKKLKPVNKLTPIDVIDELIEGIKSNKKSNIDNLITYDSIIDWLERQKQFYKI